MGLGTTKQAKINNKLVIMDHEIKQGARLRQIPTQYLLNLVDFYFKSSKSSTHCLNDANRFDVLSKGPSS